MSGNFNFKILVSFLLFIGCIYSSVIGQTDSSGQKEFTSGKAFFHERNYREALDKFLKAETLGVESTNLYYFIGKSHMMLGGNKEAMQFFNLSIKSDSSNHMSYKERGKLKAYYEDYWGSVEDFNMAIRLKKDFSDAFFNRGTSYIKLKKYDLAIDDFTTVLGYNENDPEAWYRRGNAKYNNGNKKDGCQDWSKSGELGNFKVYETIKKFCND